MKWKEVLRANYRLLLLVFLTFLLMVLVSYFSISSIMEKQLHANAVQNLRIVDATIETILMEPEVTMVNAAMSLHHMIKNGSDVKALEVFLAELTDWLLEREGTVSGFNGMYGYLFDTFLDGLYWVPPEDYVPQERPWYTAAMEAGGEIALTAPYVDAHTKEVILTLAQAQYTGEGDFIGVLALDMQVVKLVEYVHGIKLSTNGYSIMADEDLNIFAHPDDRQLSTNLRDVYPSLAQALQNDSRQMQTLALKEADGSDMLMFSLRLKSGWHVLLMTPMKDFYSDIRSVLWNLSLLGVMLMALLDFFLVRLNQRKILSDQENMSKSTFLANMSHEIRTPMNAIIGMSEIALRDPDISPAIEEHIAGIRQAGTSLLSLINDILDFSKIDAGKVEVHQEPYLLSSLVNDVIHMICARLSDKPVLLVANIDCRIPNRLIGDEVRIRQVMLNVLGNAVKYTDEGYVSLAIDFDSLGDGAVQLTIRVADSGIGIRPEALETLFADFTRVDTTRNQQVEGTGLGLAITQNLCQLMGGAIQVSSQPGEGSTFTISLPQGVDACEPFAQVRNPEALSVLVYEPRDIYGASILRTMDNLGVDCTLAISHSTFVEALHRRSFSHIFVSSFLYDSVQAILARMGVDVQLVLLAEFGEVLVQKDALAIAMPAHAMSIANLLNNEQAQDLYQENANHGFSFIAPTARVLIVDDIETNLKVAAGLLAPYQMELSTATSGPEALALVGKNKYDLVLMDHMMPGMDGVEVTAHIREMEGDPAYYQSLPIIALTANAMTGMREMFLNNGFNDFLAKPIETALMHAIMEKWIPKEKQQPYVEIPSQTALPDLALENLDITLGLSRTGGNAGYYAQTLAVFAKDGREKQQQMRESFTSGDLALFTTQAHALKSAAASVGAVKLSTLAQQLESAGRRGDSQALATQREAFEAELTAVLANVDQYLNKEAPPAENTRQEENLRYLSQTLGELKEALRQIDITTSDRVLKALRDQPWAASTRQQLEDIAQRILLFEYDEAIEEIDKLLARK